jgi:hypothetical protein
MVDEEDTQNAGLWLLQLLYGQCGALHCHLQKDLQAILHAVCSTLTNL